MLVLSLACDDRRPARTPTPPTTLLSPSPVPGPPLCPPCPPPGAYALSGVVKAAGVFVEGATVGLVKLGPQIPVSPGPEDLIAAQITRENGSYAFPSVENVSFSGALVSVVKHGYFTETKYILMSEDRQVDFALEPAAFIPLGQVVRSPVGDARCASFGYGGMGGAVCRRLAVAIPSFGTLEVLVRAGSPVPFDVTILRPNGSVGIYGSSNSPMMLTLTVAAGLTYQVDVVAISPSTREFELTATLR